MRTGVIVWGFQQGKIYNRRADIHARFGGQQQGGIITPSRFALVIAITGDAGLGHGCHDRPRADGVFEYFGEGQVGPMELIRGNRAIAAHAADGKDLLLFKKEPGGLRFEGSYVCEGFHFETAPDTKGNDRSAIVFELRPLDAIIEDLDAVPPVVGVDLDELRNRALAAANFEPGKKNTIGSVFERSRAVRDYVRARAKGHCEGCGKSAPFVTEQGVPFLEVHHILRLTDGGPDDPRFAIALCPNCHREAHFGRARERYAAHLVRLVGEAEGSE